MHLCWNIGTKLKKTLVKYSYKNILQLFKLNLLKIAVFMTLLLQYDRQTGK